MDKTVLARRLGVSRHTIYHWIETGQLDRDLDDTAVKYAPRPPVATKLDPYQGIIPPSLTGYDASERRSAGPKIEAW